MDKELLKTIGKMNASIGWTAFAVVMFFGFIWFLSWFLLDLSRDAKEYKWKEKEAMSDEKEQWFKYVLSLSRKLVAMSGVIAFICFWVGVIISIWSWN
jgi:flagellar biosynthesis protein FlhB